VLDPVVSPLSAYGAWLRASLWAYPALEVVHIASIGVLFGSLLVLDLRLFGLARSLAVRVLASLTLPLALFGFAGAAMSGLLLFAADADDLLLHPAFRLKMLLLMLAGLNAAAFHARSGLDRGDLLTRVQLALSLMIWVGVIICGRAIAYL